MSNFPFYNQLCLSTWIAYPRAQFTIRGHGFVIQRHGLWFIKRAHRFHTECRFIFGSFVASADPSGALYIKQGREAKMMCRSMYIHTEKKKINQAAVSKQKPYIWKVRWRWNNWPVSQSIPYFEDIYFPKDLLVLQFDKTHNECDTIKSTKVLHFNSNKL